MSVDRNKCESSYPYNIAQSRTYKPATSALGCNTVSLNTDSTQTMKRGQKWAYCVEALGLIYTSASSNPVFCVKINFYILKACWQV